MADENPPRSEPDASSESEAEKSHTADTVRTPPPYRRSKRRRNILILLIALVVVVSGVFLWRYLSSY